MGTDTATFSWLKLDQPALPLTVENVMTHISSNGIYEKVNDLGKGLGIPEPQIQTIISSTLTSEDYLQRLISIWLKTDGIPASWRLLIWKLDWMGEISVADQLKSFSEPLKDSTMTVENVKKVISLIESEDARRELWDKMRVPKSRLSANQDDADDVHRLCDYYVNCHPWAQWTHLNRYLYRSGLITAFQQAKKYVKEKQKDSTLTVENVTQVLTHWSLDENWKKAFATQENREIVPQIVLDKIEQHHPTKELRYEECAKFYLLNPDASWTDLAFRMYMAGAKSEDMKYLRKYLPPKDHTLTAENLRETLKEAKSFKWNEVGWYIRLPESLMDDDVDDDAKWTALTESYGNDHPCPSWDQLQKLVLLAGYRNVADQIRAKYVDSQKNDLDSSKDNSTVAKAHILSVKELQALDTLLGAYSSQNVKEIREAIRQGGEITLEMVKKSLLENGQLIANDLEERLRKGVKNLKHYEAYEQALKEAVNLMLTYLKMLFFGPPRSGKSSTRQRLNREIINLSSIGGVSRSTGVAETNDVIIKKLTCVPAAITKSEWSSLKKGGDDDKLEPQGNISYLAKLFYQLISMTRFVATADVVPMQRKTKDTNSIVSVQFPSEPTPTRTEAFSTFDSLNSSEILQNSEMIDIEDALQKLSSILLTGTLDEVLTELIMINMVDVGGQPAFLEMLPTLTIGPALYFLFFRLDQDLENFYQVRFLAANQHAETQLDTSYCIEEVLNQALSTVACFGFHPQQAKGRQQSLSAALMFGTFKDKVSPAKILEVDDKLTKKLHQTNLQKDLLLKTTKGELFFAVDNMDGDESEMNFIRKNIEDIIYHHFPAIPIPASWLMFRIALHLLGKPIVSLDQCKYIAKKLLMPTPVEDAVWFFHHNIGSLMHFSDVPSMKNVVICDPQVIFDSVSELIIDTFKIQNRDIPNSAIDEFNQKGQFTLDHIKNRTKRTQLSLEQVVELLKDRDILAEIKPPVKAPQSHIAEVPGIVPFPQGMIECEHDNTGGESKLKYVMPAVLKCASKEELDCLAEKHQTCSFMIHFKCGFVPFGVFCAGIAYLIGHQDFLSPKWYLSTEEGYEIKRNRATFLVDGTFLVHLISRLRTIQIHILPCVGSRKKKSLTEISSIVRQTVVEVFETVISKMKYKEVVQSWSDRPFHVAFICCLNEHHHDHLMDVKEDGEDLYAVCIKGGYEITLKKEHLLWFGVSEEERVPESYTTVEEVHVSTNDVKSEGSLDTSDLVKIQNLIWDGRVKWKNIGLNLGIDFSTLDVIEENYPQNVDKCFQVMLTKWLQSGNGTMLSDLIQALRAKSVGFEALADEIELKGIRTPKRARPYLSGEGVSSKKIKVAK